MSGFIQCLLSYVLLILKRSILPGGIWAAPLANPLSAALLWDCSEVGFANFLSGWPLDLPISTALFWDCSVVAALLWDCTEIGFLSGWSLDLPISTSLFWNCTVVEFDNILSGWPISTALFLNCFLSSRFTSGTVLIGAASFEDLVTVCFLSGEVQQKVFPPFYNVFHVHAKIFNLMVAFRATCKIKQPIQPIWHHLFALSWNALKKKSFLGKLLKKFHFSTLWIWLFGIFDKRPQGCYEVKNSIGLLQGPRLMAWTTKSPVRGNHWVPWGCRAHLGSVKRQIKWQIISNLCCLFRMSVLIFFVLFNHFLIIFFSIFCSLNYFFLGCDAKESIWICVTSGVLNCGRYVKAHGLAHYEKFGHSVCMDCHELSVFW